MSVLPGLGSHSNEAIAINKRGDVVGYSGPDDNTPHACIWSQGVVTDLNTLIPAGSGWVLQRAVDINDSETILGIGDYQGQDRAFLLAIVPEPSTFVVLACGMVGIRSRTRKRRSL